MSERTYVSDKILCRLCTCDGVRGTLLCKEHLEGYTYACRLLQQTAHGALAKALQTAIEQAKEQPIVATTLAGTVMRGIGYSRKAEVDGVRYLPCLHVFGSKECGVSAQPGVVCDHSAEACRALGNFSRFTGQPITHALPGQVVCKKAKE
jgi:hypothetical protein